MKRALILPLGLVIVLLTAGAARRRAALPPQGPTYDNEVVRILQTHCQSCHHENDVAPFPLMTYRDAAAHAAEIKYMTGARLMPPWKAAEGCGDFAGVRTMSAAEIETIARWVDGGAPEGKPSDLPPARQFDSAWPLGQPDVVLSMARTFTPPATRDEYRCFSMPIDAPNDLHVSAIDFRPLDRGSVHHIIPFLDRTGASASLDPDGRGYSCFGGSGISSATPLGGWSPGARPVLLPEGVAVRIPRGSKRIVMQVHYSPHFGKVLPDRTEIGLYLAKGEVTKELQYGVLDNDDFVIPAGDPDHLVQADTTIPAQVEIYSVYPHMHLLGRTMNLEAVLPDGTRQCMISIPAYDFNWQGAYLYRTPLTLPRGTRLHLEAHYDNSAENLRNPSSPPKDVHYGEASTDEMCLALFGYVQR